MGSQFFDMSTPQILRVGIIGCGEVSQVCHIPMLNFLDDKYRITYLCDVSKDALKHCATAVKFGPPKLTTKAEELCSSPDVDVVLICSGDEYHVMQGIMALENDKWTLIEKPLAMCVRDIDLLVEAEKRSKGKVFVGTMRRFATAFLEVVQEVGGMDKILYARVRSIIGPNSNFVNQSGTYPRKWSDYTPDDIKDRARREADIFGCALQDEFGVAVTTESMSQLRILGR